MSINNSPSASEKSMHSSSGHSLLKSTSILSFGTLTSRILGFIRNIILAKYLGTEMAADAFFVAWRIPNLLRSFVGEGATHSAVVPVLSENLIKKDNAPFWSLVNVIFSLGLIILSVITVVGVLGSGLIVRVIAPGFVSEPDKLQLAVRLTRVIFPYLIFIGLTALSMGVLFTFRSFWAPAFSPCFLNIAIITSAYFCTGTETEAVFILASGILIGGLLQLLVNLKPLWNLGFRFRKPVSLRHPEAVKMGKLLLPRMVGSGVYQLTVLIDTFCASLAQIVGEGGISAIWYANSLIYFPMGIFGSSLASAILPDLSGFAAKKDFDSIKKTIKFSLEHIYFIMFPITVLFMLLAQPIIRILFQRGEFGAYSTGITADALLFYAVGLSSFAGVKIMVMAFHALQDTKTPVKVAAVSLILNALLNFILMVPLKIGGIALASSIAATVNFLFLYRALNRRLEGLQTGLLFYCLKVMAASVVMGLGVHVLWNTFTFPWEVLKLFLTGVAAVIVYLFSGFILRIYQVRKTLQWFRK